MCVHVVFYFQNLSESDSVSNPIRKSQFVFAQLRDLRALLTVVCKGVVPIRQAVRFFLFLRNILFAISHTN